MRLIKLGEVSQINSSNIEHLKLAKIGAELKFVLSLNYPTSLIKIFVKYSRNL